MAKTVSETVPEDDLNARLSALEEELKSIETQIQQILLDLREQVLEFNNPLDMVHAPVHGRVLGNGHLGSSGLSAGTLRAERLQ